MRERNLLDPADVRAMEEERQGHFPVPKLPKPGLYRHAKNGELYRLLFLAKHSETDEILCIYSPCYESGQQHCHPAQMMARPAEMWSQNIPYKGQPFLGRQYWLSYLDEIGSERDHDEVWDGPRFIPVGGSLMPDYSDPPKESPKNLGKAFDDINHILTAITNEATKLYEQWDLTTVSKIKDLCGKAWAICQEEKR